MFSFLIRISQLVFMIWSHQKMKFTADNVRTNSITAYIYGVRALRALVVGGVILFLILVIAILSLLGVIYGIWTLQPWDQHTFAMILFFAGSAVLLGILILIGTFLCEGRWIRAFGIDELIEEIQSQK